METMFALVNDSACKQRYSAAFSNLLKGKVFADTIESALGNPVQGPLCKALPSFAMQLSPAIRQRYGHGSSSTSHRRPPQPTIASGPNGISSTTISFESTRVNLSRSTSEDVGQKETSKVIEMQAKEIVKMENLSTCNTAARPGDRYQASSTPETSGRLKWPPEQHPTFPSKWKWESKDDRPALSTLESHESSTTTTALQLSAHLVFVSKSPAAFGAVMVDHNATTSVSHPPGEPMNASKYGSPTTGANGDVAKDDSVCRAKGCKRLAVADSVCGDHGAKAKHPRCKVEGCFKQAVRGKVCISHGAVVKYNRCKEDGCHKYARSRGVCVQHGALSPRCRVPSCKKQAVQGGVCIGHGARVKYKRCMTRGCSAHAGSVGLCVNHRVNLEYVACDVAECSRYAKVSGKCIRHHTTTA